MAESHAPLAEIASKTDPGRDPEKQVNEDACAEASTAFGHLAFVCDGMGGHANGREASELATKTILEWFRSAPRGGSPRDVLRGAIEEANRQVYRLAAPSGPQAGRNAGAHAGSTCVAVLVHPGGTEVAHVGDSRGMLFHQGQLFPLTRDHSRVQQMVDAELITPEQAAHHPDANQITRALGIAPEVEVELRPQPVPHIATDVFLLSSDGLTDLVKPTDIVRIINDSIARGGSSALQSAANELVELANNRGGHDNITVVLARPFTAAAKGRQPVAATVTEEAPAHTGRTGTDPAPPIPGVVHGTQLAMPAASALGLSGSGSYPRVSLPTPPPSVSRRRKSSGTMVAVAVLAFVATLVAAGVILYSHFESRNGAAHDALDAASFGDSGLPLVAASVTPSATSTTRGPLQLVPTSVTPSASSTVPPLEPLAPLNAPASPASSSSGTRSHPHVPHSPPN